MIGRVGMCRGHEPEFLKDVIWIVKDRVAPEAGFMTVGKAPKGLQRPRCNEPIQSCGAKLRFGNESYVPEMSVSRKRAGVAWR